MIALGRVDTQIVTRDAAVPVLVRLGAVKAGIVAKGVEVGNTRRVAATEMVEIVTENEVEEVMEVVLVVLVVADVKDAMDRVAVEDVVVRTETRCEPVERMHRPSMEPPDRHCSCTAITSSCSNTSSGLFTNIGWTFRRSARVPG